MRIADSIEGHVVDVGWRSTRVRMLANNVVIVPNKKVAESIITNYDMPERRMAAAAAGERGLRQRIPIRSKPC